MTLEDYRADMDRCSRCSYCKWIPFDHMKSWRFSRGCPSISYNNFMSYSARGRYAVGLSLLNGGKYSEKVQDIVFKCVTCGSCDVSCKVCRYDLEPLEAMIELRSKLVEDGEAPLEYMAVIDSLRHEDNMMMKPRHDRGDWAEGLDIKHIPTESAEVLFHAGCRFSYDEELRKTVRTAVSLMKNCGIDIGIMGKDESCCGGRAYHMGYKGEFIKFAQNAIEAWKSAGVKTVVTSCSDGYHAFTRLYPRLEEHFEVLHTVQFLERLIQEGKITFKKTIPIKVTYHDPCHLGRTIHKMGRYREKNKKSDCYV